MKDMKGFTLVELLAVIVILAIVALVTTPAILTVINDSREKGAQDKAWGTIDAVKLSYTQAQNSDSAFPTTGNYKVCFGSTTDTTTCNITGGNIVDGKTISMSGDAPKSGYVTINLENGSISATDLNFTGNGNYTCSTNGTGTKMCCEANAKETVKCED